MTKVKPAIFIYEFAANPHHLKEICAGLEEEGLPFEIARYTGGNAEALAHLAASNSLLTVGIGITQTQAALSIRNLAKPIFAINPTSEACRKLGTNAARAVKGGVFI